ncbi:MAG: Proline--tRNA ligase [Candidatus Heimdallarchaeota archaeon LC_3]|nr:MAG: Proline--tRNA ligase [Candidatus Heimdallarchaeota archaeon LC_3]
MNNKLEEFLIDKKLIDNDTKIISFHSSTHTSKEAAIILGVTTSEIIKSIVMIMENKCYLAILPGNKKLRQKAVRKAIKNSLGINYSDSRLANGEEVLKFTGYEVGAVPPININLPVILDSSITEKQTVYAGGGTTTSILKISVKKLLKLTNPIIFDIGRINE